MRSHAGPEKSRPRDKATQSTIETAWSGRSVTQESLGTASRGTRGVAAFSWDGVRPFCLGLQFQIHSLITCR